ncbi:MAG: DUF4292 domain-containing protein [Bacteroidota bacterium]
MRSIPLLLIALAALSWSCSPKTVSVAAAPRNVELEEIDFEYLHGKARLVIQEKEKEREVKAHIRIRKDSVIWMTFTVLGGQGGKALINKDSITVVSTVNKEYFVFNYPELSKRFNFDINYDVVQAAMLGNLIAAKSLSDEVTEDETYDFLTQRKGKVSITNAINKKSRKLERLDMKEPGTENALHIEYSNFQPLGTKQFPYNGLINVIYKTATGIVLSNTSIILEYSKAEIGDRQLKFPFNIPRKYDRR